MTSREFYTSIINYLDGADMDGEAVQNYAREALAKLDVKNEKAKARPRKVNAEVAARREAVDTFFNTNSGEFTADEIAEALELSPAQVSSAFRTYIADGKVSKGVRKIDSKHTKVTYIW